MTFPLQPVAPKKMPLAMASLRASDRTVPTLSWNLPSSCLLALNACTVRSAESASCATFVMSPRASWVRLESSFRYRP